MAKATTKKSLPKSTKTTPNSKQRFTGSSTNLKLEEALNEAIDKIPSPGQGSDIVTCIIEKLEVSRGGIADLRTLTVTLISK
jgi:hypothetical protein